MAMLQYTQNIKWAKMHKALHQAKKKTASNFTKWEGRGGGEIFK